MARGGHARRLDAPLGDRRPARPRPPLPRPLGRRRVRDAPTAAATGAAQRRLARDVLPRPRARVRPRSALRPPAPAAARPALPAEPLRHLPHGARRRPVAAHRRQHAARRRRHRLPDRVAPPRPRHGVGVPHGRHRRVAPHEPRRPPGRLRDARRRRVVGALGRRPARTGLAHREAPGHDRRRRATRSACTSARPAARCGRAPTRARLDAHRRAPPRDLLGRVADPS